MDSESDASHKCCLEFAILFVSRGNVHASIAELIWEWADLFLFGAKEWKDFQIGASFRLDLLGTLRVTNKTIT